MGQKELANNLMKETMADAIIFMSVDVLTGRYGCILVGTCHAGSDDPMCNGKMCRSLLPNAIDMIVKKVLWIWPDRKGNSHYK